MSRKSLVKFSICGRYINGRLSSQKMDFDIYIANAQSMGLERVEQLGEDQPSIFVNVKDQELDLLSQTGANYRIVQVTTYPETRVVKSMDYDEEKDGDVDKWLEQFKDGDEYRIQIFADGVDTAVFKTPLGDCIVLKSGTEEDPRVEVMFGGQYYNPKFAENSAKLFKPINDKSQSQSDMKKALEIIKKTRLGIKSIEPETITPDTSQIKIHIEVEAGHPEMDEVITLTVKEDGELGIERDNPHDPTDDDDPDKDPTNIKGMNNSFKEEFNIATATLYSNRGGDVLKQDAYNLGRGKTPPGPHRHDGQDQEHTHDVAPEAPPVVAPPDMNFQTQDMRRFSKYVPSYLKKKAKVK